ncbi:hypothetical protein EDD85DRAFT_796187 [Armillaria nabsnona]|nr:hypothetical protein EDD85DRAFT_796187 [Armillaria nabsnona]
MAQPTDPAELAKVQAQDLYNAVAVGIEDLLDDFPNPTWNSTKMDTWLIDAVSHLTTCEQNWLQAGVTSKAWYKLEYSLIMRVPDLSMDLVVFSRSEFNELVGWALDYDLDVVPLPVRRATSQCTKATASPSHPRQNAAATHSRVTTPAPLPLASKPLTPMPATPMCAPPATPKPSTLNSEASNEQVAQPLVNNATGAHPQTILKTVKPMPITAGSGNVTFPPDSTSPLHQQPAAARSSVIPGPNPVQEGGVASLPIVHGFLFFPGTDDEEDLVGEERAEEVAVTDGDGGNMGGPDNEEGSPPSTKKARHLRQQPRISSPVPPVPTQDLPQGSKADVKKTKKKKSVKGRDKTPEAVVPCKWARNDSEEDAPVADKSATKRLKSKGSKIDEVEVVHATSVVCKRGPGPSKPPPVTLGVSGGGFGEKVPLTVKALKNGIESIGVLKVDKDFGDFVEVDNRYWSKSVAPFVGERYMTACDHCRRLGTQCRKLLTHTVKCLPCKVNGVPALNPVAHYRSQGYDAVNAFEAAVNAIEANNTAIAAITQQFLVGLNVIAHTDSIRAQTFNLRGCLTPVDEDNDDDADLASEDEAPDDVLEGITGPSKKTKKTKSC